jgi:hypothetical protein
LAAWSDGRKDNEEMNKKMNKKEGSKGQIFPSLPEQTATLAGCQFL